MDAHKPTTRINPAQETFDRHQAAVAAQRARKAAQSEARGRTKPGAKETGEVVRIGDGGCTADKKPSPSIDPKRSGGWTPWGTLDT